MNIDLGAVNWLAVIVSGVAAFVLGGLWYSVLFGKLWIRAYGWSDEKAAEMKAKMSPAKFLGGMILSYTVLAAIVAILIGVVKPNGAAGGATFGAILWAGPAAAITYTGHLAADRRFAGYVIDAAFQLVALLTQGAILGAWR